MPGCVTADDPTVLVLMNAQSRDLRRHCPVWVDVTGITYDTGTAGVRTTAAWSERPTSAGSTTSAPICCRATATIVTRPETDLAAANAAVIAALRPLFTSGQFVLRSTR